jgi:molybdopterin-binding protein
MKLSARDKLKGTIVEVKKGALPHAKFDLGGAVVTASNTNEAAEELRLAAGQADHAIIKASDVMSGSTSDNNRSAAALALRPPYPQPPP